MMPHTLLLIGDDRIQIHIFHTLKNIALDKGILFLHLPDQFLDLDPLGAVLLVVAGGTGVCKFAGTLDKVQMVVIPPCLDIILPHKVERSDQLHPLEVCAVQPQFPEPSGDGMLT